MKCLYCNFWECYPEAVAGLCVSCEWGIRLGDLYPQWWRGDLRIFRARQTFDRPLGAETEDTEGVIYDPRHELPDAPEPVIQAMRAELVELWQRQDSFKFKARAKRLIAAIRAYGIGIELDRQNACVTISHPGCVPYPLLVEFVSIQLWIADELTFEDRDRLREEEEARRRAEDASQLARCTTQAHHEHNTEPQAAYV